MGSNPTHSASLKSLEIFFSRLFTALKVFYNSVQDGEIMRYFITEDERKRSGSTAFIEFQKGRYDGSCWHIDSVCMDEDLFGELHLRRFFSMVLPQFDYYGITQVSVTAFEKLKDAAINFSSDVCECLNELEDWVKAKDEDMKGDNDILFTICGM